jgi:uncharacterized protein (TIGR00297 family)
VSSSLRRAVALALVATLALGAPVLGRLVAVPFGLVAVAALVLPEGAVFDAVALPADHRAGRLNSLAGFALGAAGFGLLLGAGVPVDAYVATVLVVGYGNLGARAALTRRPGDIVAATGFLLAGALAAVGGQAVAGTLLGAQLLTPATVFVGASGGLAGALLREVFGGREDAVSLFGVGFLLWLLAALPDAAVSVGWPALALALAAAGAAGHVSWWGGPASGAGRRSRTLLGLLTVVLGGVEWFVVLVAFFGVGGLASKFRYEEKAARGVAEEQGGARGSGNVLGNAAPALVALLLFAVAPRGGVEPSLFRYAFAGSVATALADTLSSEVGVLFDDPRLVTTLEPVPAGTDGAVTWQGELAGGAGAVLIAVLSLGLFDLPLAGGAAVAAAGVLGMTVDSLLGAAVEGGRVGNQTVNVVATAGGAVAGGILALAVGLAGL